MSKNCREPGAPGLPGNGLAAGPKEPIGIIGIGCRFPGKADDPEAFWQLLCGGVDAVSEVPADRWNRRAFYDPDPNKRGKTNSCWGGFVERIDGFDAGFFGMSPREATRVDPQHRLILEVAWEALEDGGLVAEQLADSSTGVFVGISGHEYGNLQTSLTERKASNAYTMIGSAASLAANRVSYVFDFSGPSIAVDTACSSSLVAVHLACQSIWNGESTLALVGGVNLLLRPELFIGFSQASMLSPDGRCKSFAAGANGFVRAEGAGMVVLKPLARARQDGDRVYAVILGSAVNQDGHTPGICMPSDRAQEMMLREAYQQARVDPSGVQYIEAHGTGTPAGDPIEARALGRVLGAGRQSGSCCVVGSVKSNIGHLEAGSGIAGLIKTALALSHRQIPPSLHCLTPNPEIDFESLRLRVPGKLEPWPENVTGLRLAGVNSFGFGGTNAHVVLAEATSSTESSLPGAAVTRGYHLVPLSARSPEALAALAQSFRGYLLNQIGSDNRGSLSDIGFTAGVRRSHHNHRLAVAAPSLQWLNEHLAAFLAGESRADLSAGRAVAGSRPRVVFVFTGMGSQWWGMGRQLLDEQPIFRQVVEECDRLLRAHSDWSLLEELTADRERSRLHEARIAQPAMFTLQVALAALWRSWGVEPDAIVGHSVGEVAAAYVSGALDLPAAVRVIFHRSRLQHRLTGQGKMLAVGIPAEEATRLLSGYHDRVSIAAVNSPKLVTLSGEADALGEIQIALQPSEIFCRFLDVDIPYHSPKMDLLQAEFAAALEGLAVQPPRTPLYSTVTSMPVDGQVLDPGYWWCNLRDPVHFAGAVAGLLEAGHTLFLEIGPHPVLATALAECAAGAGREATVLASLRRGDDEQASLLRTLGKLYTQGYPVDWSRLYPEGGRLVKLPSYPWQREPYWQESEESRQDRLGLSGGAAPGILGQQVHPLLGRPMKLAHPAWNVEIDLQQDHAWLADHRLEGMPVYPGAAYVEMALAAGGQTFGQEPILLEEVEFHKLLPLAGGAPRTLQLLLEEGHTGFAIHSQEADGSWTRHASGKLRRVRARPARRISREEIRSRCPREVAVAEYYQQIQDRGLEYGPYFKGLEGLWCGPGEALGEIRLSSGPVPELEKYLLPPAVLDSCFQCILGAIAPGAGGDGPYVLGQFARLCLYQRRRWVAEDASRTPSLWSHARLVEQRGSAAVFDMRLFDEAGDPIVDVQGLRCQAVKGAFRNSLPNTDDCLYEHRWHLEPRPGEEPVGMPGQSMPSPGYVIAAITAEVDELSEQLERGRFYQEVAPQLTLLSVAHIVRALQQLGWEFISQKRVSTDLLAEQLGVVPEHRRVFARLLGILEEEGTLRREGEEWEVVCVPATDPQALWQSLIARYPAYQGELILMGRCGANLARILRGEVDGLSLIFSGGSLAVAEHLYQDAPSFRFYNLVVRQALAAVLACLPPARPVRILEVGAGTGGLTSHVLPVLPGDRTEYVFTDISAQFTSQAEQKFQSYPFVHYRLLNVEKDPLAQGFEAHSFDVVLASSMLHATADLRRVLEYLKLLLAPGGLLVALEANKESAHGSIVFGLLKGWWLFSDLDLRPTSPLLSMRRWQDLLIQQGFAEAEGVSDAEGEDHVGQMVLIAQLPGLEAAASMASAEVSPPKIAGRWMILTDRAGVGEQLAVRLQQSRARPILVRAGEDYRRLAAEEFQVRPGQADDMKQLFGEALAGSPSCRGIVHLWSLDVAPVEQTTLASLEAAQTGGCLSVVSLVQGCADIAWSNPPRLWLVTRGVQPAGGVPSLSVAQAPLWGLARVMGNECPYLRPTLVDLSPSISPEEIGSLCLELGCDDREDEIALRGTARYVHRLVPVSLTNLETAGPTHSAPGFQAKLPPTPRPFRVVLDTPGLLETLTHQAAARRAPGPGEVEVEVHAAGLNFKDVMLALGMLVQEASPGGQPGSNLGIECAGKIVALGKGVQGFAVGDAVFGSVPAGAFASHLVTNARYLALKPASLTFEEAATIPVCFQTVLYSLHYLAHIQANERVPIHAGSGGIGLAAIQLAQLAGAEVFATAGSADKREFLQSLGVQHVMDSRSLDFAEEILESTGGEGVDIVLNSLAGEALAASLAVLRSQGRFLEIGKRDILGNTKLGLRPFAKDLAFFAMDLDRVLKKDLDLPGVLLRDYLRHFEAGRLHPLPYRAFPAGQVAEAFRHMAKARHIGKIVVSFQDSGTVVISPGAETSPAFPAEATYLISGGLGGFGLATARWLVDHGARHLVLLGRSGAASPAAQAGVHAMRQAGAKAVVAQVDVTCADQVARMLANLRKSMPPLHGLVHTAMVLDDVGLLQLDSERFHRAWAPKALGAWNLHSQTLNDPIDFFVLFSSATAVIGNLGQANYVAGNSFLDTLARQRRAQGLPALSIQWGAVSDVGYVARFPGEFLAQRERLGMQGAPASHLLQMLGELLHHQAIQTTVMAMDWSAWARSHPLSASPRFVRVVSPNGKGQPETGPEPQEANSLRASILAADPAERRQLLESQLCAYVAKVLGAAVNRVDVEQPLTSMGLDSLMAVELSTLIQKRLGVALPSMKLILNSPSIAKLAIQLAAQWTPGDGTTAAALQTSQPQSPSREGTL